MPYALFCLPAAALAMSTATAEPSDIRIYQNRRLLSDGEVPGLYCNYVQCVPALLVPCRNTSPDKYQQLALLSCCPSSTAASLSENRRPTSPPHVEHAVQLSVIMSHVVTKLVPAWLVALHLTGSISSLQLLCQSYCMTNLSENERMKLLGCMQLLIPSAPSPLPWLSCRLRLMVQQQQQ